LLVPPVTWSCRGAPNLSQRKIAQVAQRDTIAGTESLAVFASQKSGCAIKTNMVDLAQKDHESGSKATQGVLLAKQQLPSVNHAAPKTLASESLSVHKGYLSCGGLSEDEKIDVAFLCNDFVRIPLGSQAIGDDEQSLANPHEPYGTFKPRACALIDAALRKGIKGLLRSTTEILK
jgi:hypothetical protein